MSHYGRYCCNWASERESRLPERDVDSEIRARRFNCFKIQFHRRFSAKFCNSICQEEAWCRCSKMRATRARLPPADRPSVALFDHVIGKREQRRWDSQTQCLGDLQIHYRLESCGSHHRHVGGFLTSENTPSVDAN